MGTVRLEDSTRPTHTRRAFAALSAALCLSALACQVDIGGPAAPGDPIPVSTEAAAHVRDAWQSAVAGAVRTGSVTLLFDESQMTSFLALRLQAQEDPLLHEPQVFLRRGVIEVYGLTRRGPLQASVLITIAPQLDSDGSLTFQVISADVGPLPLPDAIRDSLSAILTEALTSPLGSLATGLRITSIAIADGQLALVAEVR